MPPLPAFPLRCLTAAISLTVAGMVSAQTLQEVVVSASRQEQQSFDAPASVQAVGLTAIEAAGPRVNLSEVMTAANYAHMEKGAERLSHGLHRSIERHGAPWHVCRVGARVEFICAPGPLRNGTEAGLAHQPQVEAAIHTALINRGTLIAPFHNMMLVSPATSKHQIDRLIASFDAILSDLFPKD